MKFQSIKYVALLTAAFLFSSYVYYESVKESMGPLSEDSKKNEVLMQLIIESLGRGHFQPQNVDDAFSEKAFNLYVKRLDFNKRFLTKSDIAKFDPYKDLIDDQIRKSNYEFFELSASVIDQRIESSKAYYKEILSKPFDFTIDESVELEPDNLDYAENEQELKERWRLILKNQTLAELVELKEEQDQAKEDNDTTVTILTMDGIEKKARARVEKRFDRWYERMDKLDERDRLSTYINSIVNIYGPHTSYFPPKDKENFDISMSGRLEGIGARLQEKDGFIKVSDIVPGSASARQGQLKAGDLILKVAQKDGEPVDVVDMRLDDAVKLIRGKKGTEVRLTVKKKLDGKTVVIPIVRDVVIIAETYAKSAIIGNEAQQKVGYIKLPKFYADFSKRGGRSCAADVRQELTKLKDQQVEGVILDLRNNGGGSLSDAVEMAGLFIEKGPIVQVKSRQNEPRVWTDKNPSIHYDGPLIVLVNSFSASASEILAAAMQDYQRAIVIGSHTSFGKGTVQKFYGLDRILPNGYDDIKPLGDVKITTQKFYRINGGATQLKGVTPDIVLPDVYSYFDTGEKEQEFVMPWDRIQAVDYQLWNPSYNLKQLVSKSENRTKADATFKLIDENAKRLKQQSDETVYTLNLEKYMKEQDALEKESEKYEDIEKEIDGLAISNLAVDLPALEADTVLSKRNDRWIKNLKKDKYLNEALYVMQDMRVN